MKEQMTQIRCRSCKRLLGVGPSDFRAYCDEVCAEDTPATINEARDALISALFHTRSMSKTSIAKELGVSRQRIDQIIALRSYH